MVNNVYLRLKENIFTDIEIDSDYQMIVLILTFAITLYRVENGHRIEKIVADEESLKYQGLVYRFMAKYEIDSNIEIDQWDINYLANKVMYRDIESKALEFNTDQTMKISVSVKEFIKLVSEKVHWNFQKNPNFGRKLTKHILGIIQHQVPVLPDTKIETLTELSKRFDELYLGIKYAWHQEFPNYKINQSEMQLLLLYFANEFTSFENNRQLSALIICENGIGTSAILSSRLKQEIPYIKKTKISRVSELNSLSLKDFDIILSTLELNGFDREYILVTPLLLNNEIDKIKRYLKNIKKNIL